MYSETSSAFQYRQEMGAIVFISFWIASTRLCLAGQVSIGLAYRNFSNIDGTLANGFCCDDGSLAAPNCPPNQCDTSFMPCATYIGGHRCEAYYQSPTMTVENMDSFVLGKFIGNVNGNAGPSTMVFPGPYSPGDIHFNILAEEDPSWYLIANFSFVIDWMEELFWDPPRWRQLVLKDGNKELGIDVFHQCAYHYFGPTCDTYCEPTHQYTCDNNGSRVCTYGWEGPDCDRAISCTKPGGLCQNGGVCVNSPNSNKSYTCICDLPYTGNYCENVPTTKTVPIMGKGKTDPGQMPVKPDSSDGHEDGPNPNETAKTESSSSSGSDQSLETIVYVSIALGVTGLVATALILLRKKMKKRSVGSKEISAESGKISEGGVSIRSSEPPNKTWSIESFPGDRNLSRVNNLPKSLTTF